MWCLTNSKYDIYVFILKSVNKQNPPALPMFNPHGTSRHDAQIKKFDGYFKANRVRGAESLI